MEVAESFVKSKLYYALIMTASRSIHVRRSWHLSRIAIACYLHVTCHDHDGRGLLLAVTHDLKAVRRPPRAWYLLILRVWPAEYLSSATASPVCSHVTQGPEE